MGSVKYTLHHHTQRTGRGLSIKHNPSLSQYPRLDALMVYAQQFQGA